MVKSSSRFGQKSVGAVSFNKGTTLNAFMNSQLENQA